MTSIKQSVAVLLCGVLAFTTPASVILRAQSGSAACDAAIDSLDRDTQQLGQDLDADVKELIKTDVADTLLDDVKTRLKGNNTAEALFDLKEKKGNFDEWVEATRNARVTMEDLARCINTRGCSLIEFAKRQNEVLAKWIERMGEEGLTKAAERVNKAASILRTYVDRSLSLATERSLSVINQCNADFERRVQTNTSNTAPSPPGAPPNAPAASTGGGGGGNGVWYLLGTAIGGGLLAGTLLKPEETFTTGGGGTTTTGGGGGTSTTATYSATVTRSCQVGSVNANPLNPGFIEPCNQAVNQGGSCSPISFTFTVTGSTVRDCGGWLVNGTASGSQVTARYDGVCGSGGITVSGPLGGTLTGSGTCRGNNYTVSIVTRRQ